MNSSRFIQKNDIVIDTVTVISEVNTIAVRFLINYDNNAIFERFSFRHEIN